MFVIIHTHNTQLKYFQEPKEVCENVPKQVEEQVCNSIPRESCQQVLVS